jgi:hypothetical protein
VNSGGAHRQSSGHSRQTGQRRPLGFREADTLFFEAETRIALLQRCRPRNVAAASSEFLAAFRRGQASSLGFRYAPAPDLAPLRRALDAAAVVLRQDGALGELYAERAAELELEARLAERAGGHGFAELARLRHPVGTGPEWDTALGLARSWLLASPPPADTRYPSDDWRCPHSLVSILGRHIGERHWPLRVEVIRELSSRAACGDGVIFVRAGERLEAAEARRIALHELFGHALPRLAARAHPLGLLRVGSARSTDDEEGRALHIEAAAELLDARRRRELGARHWTALAVADGASVEDVMRGLGQFGWSDEDTIALYARVARGGGLCRELEYLPAWLRFEAAARDEPAIAAWLALGRVSLSAARVLCAKGITAAPGGESILGLSLATGHATS